MLKQQLKLKNDHPIFYVSIQKKSNTFNKYYFYNLSNKSKDQEVAVSKYVFFKLKIAFEISHHFFKLDILGMYLSLHPGSSFHEDASV
jgi:hypothetical protein